MTFEADNERLKQFIVKSDQIQLKVDRHIFNLRTLYEVSKEIFGTIDAESILQKFLMMTMGNFGVLQSFIVILKTTDSQIQNCIQRGLDKGDFSTICSCCQRWCTEMDHDKMIGVHELSIPSNQVPIDIKGPFFFNIQGDYIGFLALGNKISGDEFNRDDLKLIETLLYNLSSALGNALAFDEIIQKNAELRERNRMLEATIKSLQEH
jgi:hypothetical protein